MIEVLAVIVILGIVASATVHRIGRLGSSSEHTALQSAIRELNIRETLTWTNLKLISNVWSGDSVLWTQMDTDLGPGYYWKPGPAASGGTLHFRSQSVQLTRTLSSSSGAAKWF